MGNLSEVRSEKLSNNISRMSSETGKQQESLTEASEHISVRELQG